MNIKYYLLVLLLFFFSKAETQLKPEKLERIDSLFLEWNVPDHPGGSIAIMNDGKLEFSKGYGLASLEYLVPNTAETIFNTGSVSKQFTAMGIVLLDLQGKLSIEDDIKTYIPDIIKIEEDITIAQLMHHTSGLRSLHALFGLAGWRGDDSRTNEDLYRILKDQKELNFKPGDEFLYCNTGYMLMAKIIEEVTGEDFPVWIKKSVFEPLGMIHTYAEDNYRRVVTNNATSYYANQNNEFERAVEYWGYVGSGNVHSTATDLMLWHKNFYDPAPGWEDTFQKMQTLDPLNNGEPNNYAYGIVIDKYKGISRIQHGGSIGGYRAFSCTFPDQKLSIAVLTNFSSSSVGRKVDLAANILLDIQEDPAESFELNIPEFSLPVEKLEKFTSHYWNKESNYARKIYVEDDTLRYFRSEYSISPLVPINENEFQMLGVQVDLKVKFQTGENGKKTMIVTINNDPPIYSESYQPFFPDQEELMKYTGEYFSPELKTSYFFTLDDEKLVVSHTRHGIIETKMLKKDIMECQYPLNMVKFERDRKGRITGFRATNGRVRNLWFEKRN
jgi:CubicO group peptidase (beta-lactamase class C family)